MAQEALAALRDLAMRWLLDDPADRDDSPGGESLPIVYRDNDLERILDVLYDMVVVSHESHQHMLAAAVLDAYRTLLSAADADVRARLLSDVATAEALLDQEPPSRRLADARRALGEEARRCRAGRSGPDGGGGAVSAQVTAGAP